MAKTKLRWHFIAAAAAMGCMLIVYAIKHLFPFGNLSIIIGDMLSQTLPFVYRSYDILTEGASIFQNNLSFFSGYGDAANYFMSPLNILISLFPRDKVFEVFNLIYILRIGLAAFTCSFFLSKTAKTSGFWCVIFSLIYAISGFTFYAHQIPAWLDVQILFPIILLNLKYILDGKRNIGYLISLSASLIISFYLSFISLLFIALFSFLYIMFFVEKENRGKVSLNIGIFTFLSLGISCIVTLPAFVQIKSSIRTSQSIIDSITNVSFLENLPTKIGYLLLNSIAVAVIILALPAIKKNFDKYKKGFVFFAILFTCMLLPVLIDNINRMFHGGKYEMYPLRHGFITCLLFITAAAYAIPLLKQLTVNRKKIINALIAVVSIVTICCCCVVVKMYYNKLYLQARYLNERDVLWLLLISVLFMLLFLFILLIYKKKVGKTAVTLVLITQVILFSTLYTGTDKNFKVHFQENSLKNTMNLISGIDDNYRVSDIDSIFSSPNYADILGMPSTSHYSSMLDANAYKMLVNWGYSRASVSVHDFGGTLFSDSLLGKKYIISKSELGQPYVFLKNSNGINLYENPYAANISMVLPKQYEDFVQSNYSSYNPPSFEAQNNFYSAVKKDKTLIDINSFVKTDINKLECTLDITEKSLLYLKAPRQLRIIKNIEILDENNNPCYTFELQMYPNSFKNGLLDLGMFENKSIRVILELRDGFSDYKDLSIGVMPLSAVEEFFSELETYPVKLEKNKIKITVKSDKDALLMLSLPYNSGWKANDGKTVKDVYGGFLAVDLKEGDNEIVLTYVPVLFSTGAFISICSILIAILFFILTKYLDIEKFKAIKPLNNCIKKLAEIALMVFGVILIMSVYVFPIILSVLKKI